MGDDAGECAQEDEDAGPIDPEDAVVAEDVEVFCFGLGLVEELAGVVGDEFAAQEVWLDVGNAGITPGTPFANTVVAVIRDDSPWQVRQSRIAHDSAATS